LEGGILPVPEEASSPYTKLFACFLLALLAALNSSFFLIIEGTIKSYIDLFYANYFCNSTSKKIGTSFPLNSNLIRRQLFDRSSKISYQSS